MDELHSNQTKKLKFYKKGLVKFDDFLKEELILVSNLHYRKLYSGLGTLLGGIALSSFDRSLGLTLGMIIGMVIGSITGKSMDAKAKAKVEGKYIIKYNDLTVTFPLFKLL